MVVLMAKPCVGWLESIPVSTVTNLTVVDPFVLDGSDDLVGHDTVGGVWGRGETGS